VAGPSARLHRRHAAPWRDERAIPSGDHLGGNPKRMKDAFSNRIRLREKKGARQNESHRDRNPSVPPDSVTKVLLPRSVDSSTATSFRADLKIDRASTVRK